MTRVSARFRDGPARLTLAVEYDGKTASIELPIPSPTYDGESKLDAYRRELRALLNALDKWEQEHGEVIPDFL
jgi:hypothetical protein